MPIGWVLAIALASVTWAALAARESLWLDELHTSWVVSDGWGEIATRAAAGNQSPWYFYLLAALGATVGGGVSEPWLLRLPSILAWAAAVATSAWVLWQASRNAAPLALPSPPKRSSRLWNWFLAERDRKTIGQANCPLPRSFEDGESVTITQPESPLPQRFAEGEGVTVSPSKYPLPRRFVGGEGRVRGLFITLWCSLLLLDRWQWFYGSEARVYALLQLISLLGWLTVWSIAQAPEHSARRSGYLWLGWIGWATLLLHLHIVSALGIAAQWLVLSYQAVRYAAQRRWWWVSLAWLALNASFLARAVEPVWQRREQWSTFAGDGSLAALLGLFPLAALLVPLAGAWAYERWRDGRSANDTSQPESPLPQRFVGGEGRVRGSAGFGTRHALGPLGFWALAAALPWLSAWLITRLGIAPLLHYRFVIVSALPLYLLVGLGLLTLRRRGLAWLAVGGMLVGLMLTQGSATAWLEGRGTLLRGENWREAARYVGQHIQPESQTLWCYAGLIEGRSMSPPLDRSQDEYLSFPLRGGYRVRSAGRQVQPHGLVGDSRRWRQQIDARVENERREAWIVCRGSRENLERRLKLAGLDGYPRSHGIVQFGRVSVVCLVMDD